MSPNQSKSRVKVGDRVILRRDVCSCGDDLCPFKKGKAVIMNYIPDRDTNEYYIQDINSDDTECVKISDIIVPENEDVLGLLLI